MKKIKKDERIEVYVYKNNRIINFLRNTFYFWTIVGIITMVYKIYRNIKWLVNIFSNCDED